MGLILLALCSCDKSMLNETETSVSAAKVQRRATMFQPSELGNWFVNPTLDDEYQLSESEIVEELMSYGFLDDVDTLDISPIYFEDVIPTFFKSLIVEPESNEWYGIDVDELMDTYIEWPSIALYVINTSSEKAFITTADKRYSCNLIRYCTPSVFYPEMVSVYEEVADSLYTQGSEVSFHEFDSLTMELVHGAFGIHRHDDLYELKMYMSMFHMQKWLDMGGGGTRCYKISPTYQVGPLLTESLRWGQCEIFGRCGGEHNLVSGSIALSILKILCLHGYSCTLEGVYFDGATDHNDWDKITQFAQLLYNTIEEADQNRSQRGLSILTACGFSITQEGCDMQNVYHSIDEGKLVIFENTNGQWGLVDGYQTIETTCSTLSYIYSIDKNECRAIYKNWGYPYPLYNVYYYELN